MLKNKVKNFVIKPIEKFMQLEAASGIILAVCAIVAMTLANSIWSQDYFSLLQYKLLSLSLQHWINDGLMAIFFFLIGMEIKKELVVGELSSPAKAALPIAAALGGMIAPALIYFYFNQDAPASNGWGIPMATDIAFALGVLTLFGRRVPLSLKVFLLALAIVDDLGAVLVIAFFYTEEIKLLALAWSSLFIGFIIVCRFLRIRSYPTYIALGIAVWIAVLLSGVHATLAGVIIGLLTPFQFPTGKKIDITYSPLEDLVHVLHPWVSFGIIPLFALANAGISITGLNFTEIIQNPIHQGVVFGLVLGKPIGITLISSVAALLGFARLPNGMNWPQLIAVSFLAGIGFTMSIFISNLALSTDFEIYSKTGIILASLVAGCLGSILLLIILPKSKANL